MATKVHEVGLLLSTFFLFTHQFSLKQIIPSDGSLVCPGNPLVFECITSTGELIWQESGVTKTFQINDKGAFGAAGRFQFEVIDVINESVIISTATIPQAWRNDTGKELDCIEFVHPLTEVVAVSDIPESCSPDAEVVCSLSLDGSNITISLRNATAGHCVVSYMFQLYQKNMTVSVEEGLTVFSMDNFFRTVQLNQKVFTMDFEGELGDVPCLFNITNPNALEEVSFIELCDGTRINLIIVFETPTFPPDCCVRADNVTWQYWYTINMTGFIPRMIEQEEDILYNVVPGTYEVVFMPIAKQLGLSGDSTSSVKVVRDICQPSPPTNAGTCTSDESPTAQITSVGNVAGLSAALGIFVTTTLLLSGLVAFLLFVLFWTTIKNKGKFNFLNRNTENSDPSSKGQTKEEVELPADPK